MRKPGMQLFSAMVILLALFSARTRAGERPNILWLTSEDNNIQWVGCYGNEFAGTPNIDALSMEGFRYTHSYANAPVCAPSRSTWITGMHALSTGTHNMRSRYVIPHDQVGYYPDYLKAAGYYVSNGKKTDYNIGGRADADCWDDMDKEGDGASVDWELLKQNQPFFKIVNFFDSHESRAQGDVENTIYDPANTALRNYHPDLPDIRKNYAKYHDAVQRMDAYVGEVLAKLEASGMAENTIVIYCSDHGGVLPRSKRYLFASGIHTPLIIRIPEKYKSLYPADNPGDVVEQIVSFIDMPKTWLSLAGAEVPGQMQGKIFLGNNKEPERTYHFSFRGRMDERQDNARAVYDKEFVYIRNYMPQVPWMQHLNYLWKMTASVTWEEAVRSGNLPSEQSKYFFPKVYTEELYSLGEDWDNSNNLINEPGYANRADQMRTALREWQLQIHDAGLLPESELVRIAKQHDLTLYEVVRDPKLYNLEQLLDISDIALEQDPDNLDKLRAGLNHPEVGVRYWSMVGCFLLHDELAGTEAQNDPSHEVRALAAWTLIKAGKKQQGMNILEELLLANSYAMLTVLNITDLMGDDGQELMETVRHLDLDEKEQSYEIRMQEYLVEKYPQHS
ncbi:MAG: sulfatase [Bacteroidales bacterium]|nr:sulfatase [Bacteroidales bacterium]MDT8430304.1 sulfatase [Bacteroidales bacterium]